MNNSKKILITIDVEDWFQVENLRPWFPPNSWHRQKLRVEKNTHRILDLLDSIKLNNTTKVNNPIYPKATFFILGWVADKLPNLISEIHQRGHEVASHGYGHMMCNHLNSNDLFKDLVLSKNLLENITGCEVKGYRAPNFSISEKALKFIKKAGYKYDSSYNNFSQNGRYGQISINGTKKGIGFEFTGNFYELPISNMKLSNQIIPWGGGGYFRLIPFPIFKAGIKQILKKQEAYIFYLHPWEIDQNQAKAKQAKGLSGWRHYMNLDKTYKRLKKLISTFRTHRIITCSQYIETLNNQ
jgi:polysaccharide deacetylase family protein (PEP-CTERM system associated)